MKNTNRFTQLILDSPKESISLRRENSRNYPSYLHLLDLLIPKQLMNVMGVFTLQVLSMRRGILLLNAALLNKNLYAYNIPSVFKCLMSVPTI